MYSSAIFCASRKDFSAGAIRTGAWTRVHGAIFAVGPIDIPLVRLRVVEAQRQSLDLAAGTIEFDLLDDGTSVPHFVRDEDAIKLHPRLRSSQGMLEPS